MTRLALEIGWRFAAMGSDCEVRLCGADEAALGAAAQAAVAEVRRIEARFSRYRPDSIVGRINAAAGSGQAIEVDDETAALLDFGAALHARSDGAFDLTSGVLRRAWDFRAAVPPAPGAVEALLPLIGWPRVRWQRPWLALPLAGMELDFGGIGKEYAADRAVGVLHAHGVGHGFVNLGGDIRVAGPRGDGSAWRFALQHPRDPQALLGRIELHGGALATSGDYERGFDHAGQRLCHVLDARTGWPVSHWQSVSVLAPASAAAGALATLSMLAGAAAAQLWRAEAVAVVAVDRYGAVVQQGLDAGAWPGPPADR